VLTSPPQTAQPERILERTLPQLSSPAKVGRAVALARWDSPPRILIDNFVAQVAREVKPDAHVLDAGAGECTYAPAFAHCNYLACDRAIGEVAWDYKRIDIVADLGCLPFRRDTFDAILCTQALEHVRDLAPVLRDMATVLKPGGRLYASVPFLGDPIHQAPYDYFRYTHYGMRGILKQAGFTPLSILPLGGIFFLWASWLWWCAIIYRTSKRDRAWSARVFSRAVWKVIGAGLLLLSRFCTMIIMIFKQTETGSEHFTYGYTVVAEKKADPDLA
jgi:SAM-dependent methyltransferase